MLNAILLRPSCGMLGSPVKPSRASSSPLLSSPAWLDRLLRLRGRPLPRACGATGCRGGGRLQTRLLHQLLPNPSSRATVNSLTFRVSSIGGASYGDGDSISVNARRLGRPSYS